MKRAGPVALSQHADWSSWRDVAVPLDEPPTAEWLVRAEAQLRRGLDGFQSLEIEPGRSMLAVVVNKPRDDNDAITAEIDGCLSAAGANG
jgi:hypothetical protein